MHPPVARGERVHGKADGGIKASNITRRVGEHDGKSLSREKKVENSKCKALHCVPCERISGQCRRCAESAVQMGLRCAVRSTVSAGATVHNKAFSAGAANPIIYTTSSTRVSIPGTHLVSDHPLPHQRT